MSTEIQAAAAKQEPGETAPCKQCGRANVATRKYCSDCGAKLWEPCLQCGASSLVGEKYCGDCGENLVQGIERLIERFEANLARVKQLRTDCRYDEAVSLLGPMAKPRHPRLGRYVDLADQLTRQLIAERDGRIARAKAVHQEANHLVAAREYQPAMRLLDDVPPAMRSREIEGLREEVRARLEEIASLDEELSTAIAHQRSIHLLPKVSRLLTLNPRHVRAAQLAERFRDRVGEAAEEKLANHQYRHALDLLDQLPENARSPQVEKLRRRAAELVWLSEDLRSAAVVDSTLADAARRLGTLAPNDQRVAKLATEVRRRLQIAAANPRRAYPPWASSPEITRLGHPIDWLTGFRRIGVAEDLAKPILVDHPGRLLVACGLALQGLQQAPLRLNLLPKENQTPLGRITAILNRDSLPWAGRKRLPRTAWGLDLSASGLKAVKLVWKEQEGAITIEDFDVLSHSKMIDEALGDDEAKTVVEETLSTFRSRHNVKADRIGLGLPTRTLLTRCFTVPFASSEKLQKAVLYEVRRQIPVPLEEVAWDYQMMVGSDGQRASKQKQEVLLVAARRRQLVDRLSTLRDAGLRVDVVQSDCLALHNFLVYDYFGDDHRDGHAPADTGRSIALLDVGCDQTHLAVSSPTSVWFRSCTFGGEQLTRALAGEFHLSTAQAEELKRHPARAKSLHRMYDTLEPALEVFLANARSMLEAFTAGHKTQRIERVLGCGGSFQLHGLLRYLRSGF